MNEIIIIPMCYFYKGSVNGYIRLQKNLEDETFSIITDYGETIATVTNDEF